jgi:PIN domain nuclease of toxin-antitoxin system
VVFEQILDAYGLFHRANVAILLSLHNAAVAAKRGCHDPMNPFVAQDEVKGLGDRACLALGIARRIPVCTADRTWHSAGLDIEIEVIR